MIPKFAVYDAGPIISFHQIHRIELLQHLFVQNVVPPSVVREVSPSLGTLPIWMEIQSPQSKQSFPPNLGAGERSAILLAMELSTDFVVLDDRRARTAARGRGLATIGSLGLLVRAKRSDLIEEVRPLMDAMIAHGLFASEGLYRHILAIAGEHPERSPGRHIRS